MLRILTTIAFTFVAATCLQAQDAYKPVTQKEFTAKVPNFFCFDYEGDPEPGKRLWLRLDDKTFVERYPSGKEDKFNILGRITVDKGMGVVVERADKGIQAFIPDKGTAKMEFKFRFVEDGKPGDWNPLAEMKKVE